MNFHAVSRGFIKQADLELFRQIERVITSMPNFLFNPTEWEHKASDNQISCHLLCRALVLHFPVRVKDGYFHGRPFHYDHSWLVAPHGAIIDAYPVAAASPFIVDGGPNSPWTDFYKESAAFNDKFKDPKFTENLGIVKDAMVRVLEELGVSLHQSL